MTTGLGWFAAQFTGTARLQREVNAALHSLMDELQTQHAQDIVRISALNGAFAALTRELQEERAQLAARISELERDLAQAKLECLQQSGEIRGLKQSRDSLQALLKRADVVIPGEEQ